MNELAQAVHRVHREYGGPEQPLEAYAGLIALYGIAFGAFVGLTETGRLKLPEHISVADILLIGIATHKLARIAALDEVTSPIRAPFAAYAGEGNAPSELSEHPRGKGVQQAIGTLLTCPYCLAPWIGVAALAGLKMAPKLTRTVAALFAITAISDWLNTAYDHAWKQP